MLTIYEWIEVIAAAVAIATIMKNDKAKQEKEGKHEISTVCFDHPPPGPGAGQ